MTHAYAEYYLGDAMKNLGEAFDYAGICGLEMDSFMELFISSGYAEDFGKGNPRVVSGISGTELVMEVVNKSGKQMDFLDAQIEYECSAEYWCGWILAYYQWMTSRAFRNIHDNISMKEVRRLYRTHHEAAEDKFVDTLNSIIKRKQNSTKLQKQRKICGYSQRELSEKSGVNLRTLQQYELGSKDISKASVVSVISLARVLGCKADELLE